MNFLEKAISIISPKSALKRQVVRMAANAIDSNYNGGSFLRRTMRNWLPYKGSALTDYDIGTQSALVARCRDAYRNQSLARAAVERLKHNAVGCGLRLQAHIDYEQIGISEKDATATERFVEREFEHWCYNSDYERSLPFSKQQILAIVSMLISGDCIVNTPFRVYPGCDYGLKVQVIEGDRLCNPNNSTDTRTMQRGVELDADGVPTAYHIMTQHPGDTLIDEWRWQRFSIFGQETGRRRIFLPFDKERPGQYRGVPFLAPILEPLRQLDRYSDAELTAAVVSALFTVFVKTDAGTPLPTSTESNKQPIYADEIALAPGAIVNLLSNENVEIANPTRPNANYDPFVMAIFKQIGAALSIPIEVLMLTFNASYSAARGALLQAWKTVLYHRSIITEQFCQPIYELFFDEMIARGKLDIPDYADPMVRFLYTRSSWVGPTRSTLDENKEVQAAKDRIDIGISSIQKESEELEGVDWLDIHKQRAIEKKMRLEAGLEQNENKSTQQSTGANTEQNTALGANAG